MVFITENICCGPSISVAYYCHECTILDKDTRLMTFVIYKYIYLQAHHQHST